ncbi:MAG: hypothetical protein FAZ92_01682 [Accumulibacter sp.]|nr:MAG: hypothetical protein FAZ92_01682 [Accumulibacter sp.]
MSCGTCLQRCRLAGLQDTVAGMRRRDRRPSMPGSARHPEYARRLRALSIACHAQRQTRVNSRLRRRHCRRSPATRSRLPIDSHGSICIHDEPGGQDRPAQAPDHQGHLALLLPRCQDRPARPQRFGQVDGAAHHGWRRPRHHRRGDADARAEDRLPAAGAAARPGQDCPPGGGIGSRRGLRRAGDARRRLRRLRRTRRRLRQARRRAGAARGDHRQQRRRPRQPARTRRRRAAPAAVGGTDRQSLGWRKAPRRALQAAALEARHAAARRADQPPRRGIGRVARAVPRPLSRHGRRRDARPLLP